MQRHPATRVGLALFCVLSTAYAQQDSQDPNALITPDHARAIYRHLVQDHWAPQTGLFLSFYGSMDRKLSQQASTYDQAAAGYLAVQLGDIKRAQGIFRFLKKAWAEGPLEPGDRQGIRGLSNFYNADFGGEGIETTIHVGPNAWAGLFAAHLGNATGDREPLAWALEVASWIAHDVPHHDGAAAMGPINGQDGVPWPQVYSVENNLSYYALLSELLRAKTTTASDRNWIEQERSRIENWLVTSVFDRTAYAMDRGVNPQGRDHTRALDTITWLIAAVGPDRLSARGIDPDRLMDTAERLYEVKVGGLAGVDPADPAEANQTPRPARDQNRMIWYEGLGQYLNALSILADYAQRRGRDAKAAHYAEKVRSLSRQFDLAALKTYPEGAAYPYATAGKLFHDGWWPPADGPCGPASSLIAAAWRCLAGLGINPLAGGRIAGVTQVNASAPQVAPVPRKTPSILYGTSEQMVVRAWKLLNAGNLPDAKEQAQATVQEWAPWAIQLQEKKAHEAGRLIAYGGSAEERKEIFSYWALNDVAAAYFIIGKTLDERQEYAQAAQAFRQIALHYPLAQVWDPGGWFWSPAEAVQNEYAGRDPEHYQNVAPKVLARSSGAGKLPD